MNVWIPISIGLFLIFPVATLILARLLGGGIGWLERLSERVTEGRFGGLWRLAVTMAVFAWLSWNVYASWRDQKRVMLGLNTALLVGSIALGLHHRWAAGRGRT